MHKDNVRSMYTYIDRYLNDLKWQLGGQLISFRRLISRVKQNILTQCLHKDRSKMSCRTMDRKYERDTLTSWLTRVY